MQLLDLQQRKEEQELQQMQEDLGRNNNSTAGHLSEPTTPPEYRETNSGFPSVFSRPNRYSTSSLTSPPGLYTRPGRSGSQLTSPQSGIIQSRLIMDDKLPSKSVPGSRRNSDEDEKEEAVRQDPTSHRSTNAYVSRSPFCLKRLSAKRVLICRLLCAGTQILNPGVAVRWLLCYLKSRIYLEASFNLPSLSLSANLLPFKLSNTTPQLH
jgi:hypothetical protein